MLKASASYAFTCYFAIKSNSIIILDVHLVYELSKGQNQVFGGFTHSNRVENTLEFLIFKKIRLISLVNFLVPKPTNSF